MANGVSKTQIDRLGDRLRKHEISDDDLRLLDLYRRAEFSEKFSDVADPAIKYGGGDKEIQTILIRSSNSVAQTELCEKLLSDSATRLSAKSNFTETDKRELAEIQKELDNVREELVNTFRQSIEKLTKLKY